MAVLTLTQRSRRSGNSLLGFLEILLSIQQLLLCVLKSYFLPGAAATAATAVIALPAFPSGVIP